MNFQFKKLVGGTSWNTALRDEGALMQEPPCMPQSPTPLQNTSTPEQIASAKKKETRGENLLQSFSSGCSLFQVRSTCSTMDSSTGCIMAICSTVIHHGCRGTACSIMGLPTGHRGTSAPERSVPLCSPSCC